MPAMAALRPDRAVPFAVLSGGSLRIYARRLDAGAGDDGPLSQDERARADRFHFDRDRTRYRAARAFLRRTLGQETGREPEDLTFAYGPHGKPCLRDARAPWFNLSHSGGIAVLALSDTGPVGIDLEAAGRAIDPMSLARTCFTARETDVLRSLPPDGRLTRFLSFWMAKEARMKLTGEGLHLAPRSIELALTDGCPTGYLQPAAPRALLQVVPLPGNGWTCAVAMLAVPPDRRAA
jgi:4'-phosphopantetheinyl transferase